MPLHAAWAARLTTAAVVLASMPVSAQEPADRVTVTIEIASEGMRGYPLLATAAGQAANRGADVAWSRLFGPSEGTSPGAVAKRLIRLWAVNMPIAAASATAAHEMGHYSRARHAGTTVYGIDVRKWPWPVPYFSVSMPTDFSSDPLALVAGGAEGAAIQGEALVDQIYRRAEANYFDWLLLAYTKLEMPAYTWMSRLSDRYGRPFDGSSGDLHHYAEEFALRQAIAHRIRSPRPPVVIIDNDHLYPDVARELHRGMWLNLADYPLLVSIASTAQYIWRGDEVTSTPALAVGAIRFLPAARYSLTPLGPETAIGTRIVGAQRLTRAEIRWIATPSDRRLWAAGVAVTPRMNAGVAPEIRIDVFQTTRDRYGLTRDGAGLRIEGGMRKSMPAGSHLADVGLRIGFKTRGYLTDAPYKGTLLGSLSFSVRF